jgi:hypothetical protein
MTVFTDSLGSYKVGKDHAKEKEMRVMGKHADFSRKTKTKTKQKNMQTFVQTKTITTAILGIS